VIFATKGRIFFDRAPPVHTDGLAPNVCQKRLLLAMAQKHCLPSFQRGATPMAGSPVKQPQYSRGSAVLAAVNAAKPGVVRVAAADASMARQCREFICAFLETDKLKPLFSRLAGDVIELRSGVSIQVDANVAKLSHGAISVIELAWAPLGEITKSSVEAHADDPVWIARAALHVLNHWIYTGEGYEQALVIAKILEPDDDLRWFLLVASVSMRKTSHRANP
jgi:hypothetical protein